MCLCIQVCMCVRVHACMSVCSYARDCLDSEVQQQAAHQAWWEGVVVFLQ